MRRWRAAAAVIAAVALIAVLPLVRGFLPMPRKQRAEERPFGGVVTVWVAATWRPGAGGFTAWVSRQARAFEKENRGVWVDVRAIEPQAAALALADPDAQLPNVLLWGSGLLSSPEGALLPLEGGGGVRPELQGTGAWSGQCYALPIAQGGHALVVNREMAAAANLPSGAGAEALFSARYAAPAGKGARAGYALHAPSTPYASGLPAALSMGASASSLPPDFHRLSWTDAFAEFALDRRAAVFSGTAYEAQRIGVLRARGGAFEYEVLVPPQSGDLLLMGSVCLPGRAAGEGASREAGERAASLSGFFLGRLLCPEAQAALREVGAFAAAEAPALYGAENAPFAGMERGLAGVSPQNVFASAQRSLALYKAVSGASSASQAAERVRADFPY